MLGNRSSDNHTKPLLGTGDNINNYNLGEEERRWWRKWKEVLDVEEAKNQVLFSLPMIVANVSYYAIPLVSVMFAGHLGDLELAGATLANSWACVTGFDFTCLSHQLESSPVICSNGLKSCKLIIWSNAGVTQLNSIQYHDLVSIYYLYFFSLECWSFDILVFLAGVMPNSERSTSLIAMCVNTHLWSQCCCKHKVSNELGAGMIDRAKNAMAVTLKLVVLLALIIDLALTFGHNIWAGFFADSQEIVQEFASMTPFLVISITFDTLQCILLGVARGCGWQHLAVWVNLATFYFIGMPLALLFGFKLNLHAKGLWIGLICGLAAQASSLFLIVLRRKFTNVDIAVSREKEVPLSI
ncbi:hypothetical protein CUMW_107210 [Citrus unshiu]|uniref:Protein DETOXIFICATION n=1 Tax=Citrus unshiu TaxID=55188 RepID=A0A2H5P630_CITUN|nr:hypothetical protein CUMW_107210 [Citrus unshiu]